MMKKGIRALALLLCLAMMVSLAACGSKTDVKEEAKLATGTPAADAVVASVGSYTVTYSDLAEYYDYYMEMMSYYGYEMPESDEDIEDIQDALLSDYVNNKKLYYYADQYGITLSEEDIADVKAQAEDEMAYYMEDFVAAAKEEGLTDEAEINARAKELFASDLAEYGIEMTPDEYADYIYDQIVDETRLTLLEDYIYAQVSVTDEDVEKYFSNLADRQREGYLADPSAYAADVEYYEKEGGDPVVYAPEGYLRVKVLYLEPESALDASYAEKLSTMAELEAEYGTLALQDEAGNSARLKEIRETYGALAKETAEMYETYISATRDKADDIHAKLVAGEDFDSLLVANGTDLDYVTYETVWKNGKLLSREGGDGWDDMIRETAISLEPGSFSKVIKVDDAYCIVYLVGEQPSGVANFADVMEQVRQQALLAAQTEHYTAVQTEWEADDSMVTYYEEVYRGIGKGE